MKLSDFDFNLPEELIAQTPSPRRGESRLLVLDRSTTTLEHTSFSELTRYLKNRPIMVFNDTRVLPVKLEGTVGEQGKSVEVLLVKEEEPGTWKVLMKNLKKFIPGQKLVFGRGSLEAEFVGRKDDTALIRLPQNDLLGNQLDKFGKMPLPHYIRRSQSDDRHAGREPRRA